MELLLNRREACRMCRGTGEIKGASCPDCRGTARKKYETTVAVVIPPGTRHGDVITVAGGGNAGFKGFPAGDLIMRVTAEVLNGVGTNLLGD
jgi:DnaJ-class molecular chaperone